MSVAYDLNETPTEALRYVRAEVNQLVPGDRKPAVYVVDPAEGDNRRPAAYEAHTVRIHDARPVADEFDLDGAGFALVASKTAITDFHDEEQVTTTFFREVEETIKRATGARKVVIFDHTRRIDRGVEDRREGSRGPVRTVHNDYTETSGPRRVRDLIDPSEVDEWLSGRFAIVNLWRTTAGPVETTPIAIADARSMGPTDFVATDLVYADRTGEIYDVLHDPAQRWYYVPKLAEDEALLIKCYDSQTDGVARFTAHTAFDDPTTRADAPPRESIEVRTLVLF